MNRQELANIITNLRKVALKCAFYDDKMSKHFMNGDKPTNGSCFSNIADDLLMTVRTYMAIPNHTPDGRINRDESMIVVDWTNNQMTNEQFIRKYSKYFV